MSTTQNTDTIAALSSEAAQAQGLDTTFRSRIGWVIVPTDPHDDRLWSFAANGAGYKAARDAQAELDCHTELKSLQNDPRYDGSGFYLSDTGDFNEGRNRS